MTPQFLLLRCASKQLFETLRASLPCDGAPKIIDVQNPSAQVIPTRGDKILNYLDQCMKMILHQQSGIRYCCVTWLCGRDFELPYLAPHFWHHHAPTRNRASSPTRSHAYSSKIFKRAPSTRCVRVVRGRASIVRSRWLPFLPPSFYA